VFLTRGLGGGQSAIEGALPKNAGTKMISKQLKQETLDYIDLLTYVSFIIVRIFTQS